MKLLMTTAIAALVAGTTAVSAGNIIIPVVEPAPIAPAPVAYDWTGFYAGLHYGGGTLDDSADVVDGTWMGGQLGYLADLGSVVVGGELSFSQVDQTFWLDDLSVVRLKGRVGYDGGKFQPYLVGGVSQWTSSTQGTGNGFVYGLGADVAVSDHVRIGAEFLRDGDSAFEFSGGGGPFDFQTNEFALRVNFNF